MTASTVKGQAGSRRRPIPPIGVKDPTQNVLDAQDAAVQRLDDVSDLRFSAIRDIVDLQVEHLKYVMELRAEHGKELAKAEAGRIDAIRVVDVNAVSVANEKGTLQAATLQTQVLASAEALRVQTAAIATGLATQLSATLGPLTDRVALIEQAQYKSQGSASVADPAIAKMALAIETLSGTSRQGAGNVVAYILGGFGFLGTMVGIISAIVFILRH